MSIYEAEFFNTISRFSNIPNEQLDQLKKILKHQTFHKNDYFIRMNDKPHKFAYINKGIFRIYCISEEGNEKTLAFRSEGQFVAPYTPLLYRRKVWYFIQALTQCDVYYISVSDYEKLFKDHVGWQILEKNYIVELFLEKEERERSLLMDSAKVRYETFLKNYLELEGRVQQNYIASYLGITPVSLNRLKSQLNP